MTDPLKPGQIQDDDGTILEPLAVWCAKNGISTNNARGQYRERIPFRKKLNRHYVPVEFVFVRKRSRRKPK